MAINGITMNANQAPGVVTRPADAVAAGKVQAKPERKVREQPKEPVTIDLGTLKKQLEKINQQLRDQQSNLAFRVDETTGKTIVRVVRESTGELVRQIPSEEAMAIAASIQASGRLDSLGVNSIS